MKRFLTLLFLLTLLSACQAQPPASTPAPTLPVLQVDLPVELVWMSEPLNACAQQTGTGVVLTSASLPADVRFHWGAPASESATATVTLLGEDALVVVANPAQLLTELTYGQFQAIFSGDLLQWEQAPLAGQNIAVWGLSPPQAAAAIQNLLQKSLRPDASLASTPESLRSAVAADPLSIGLLPARWVDSSVKVLTLNEVAPDLQKQPILVISTAEPDGNLAALLVCLMEVIRTAGPVPFLMTP